MEKSRTVKKLIAFELELRGLAVGRNTSSVDSQFASHCSDTNFSFFHLATNLLISLSSFTACPNIHHHPRTIHTHHEQVKSIHSPQKLKVQKGSHSSSLCGIFFRGWFFLFMLTSVCSMIVTVAYVVSVRLISIT